MDQLNRQGLMVDAMVKTAALDDISSVNKQQYTKNIPAVWTIFGATVYVTVKIEIRSNLEFDRTKLEFRF